MSLMLLQKGLMLAVGYLDFSLTQPRGKGLLLGCEEEILA
jgi:hypothetical protein